MKGNQSLYTQVRWSSKSKSEISVETRETHDVKFLFSCLDHILKERQHGNSCTDSWSPHFKKRRKEIASCKTKFCIDTYFFYSLWFFEILFTKKSSLMRFSDSSRILEKNREQHPERPGRWETQDDASYSNALLGIFANVGKPGWSTGCQAVLGSPGRCCSGHVARKNHYSPCALDEAWKSGPSRAPSWPGSPPQLGPSRSPAATSCPLAYCLLPELSLLRVGPGTPVLVPANQEQIRGLERENDDEISNELFIISFSSRILLFCFFLLKNS